MQLIWTAIEHLVIISDMRIYFADLFHVYKAGFNPDTVPYTVPLGISYLASTVKRYAPQHEVRLFRDPNRFLKTIRAEPPDVVGFMFCSWNSDLSGRVSEITKTTSPKIITVGGGPSVDDGDAQLIEFFDMFPAIDYLIPNEGETGFLSLLAAIESSPAHAGPIPGVAYLDDSGKLIRGSYDRPIVPGAALDIKRISKRTESQERVSRLDVDIPSPYLDGTLDPFLEEGLVPILQTMRGCPYNCQFCVSGMNNWNNPRGFDLERVKAEIDHALTKSNSKDLILTDENWGILGERDVEIARYIMNRHRTTGSPRRLYYYTAKIVTPASRAIVELVAPIAWIGEFSMSFQSLNPETRKVIKRKNITLEQLTEHVAWATEHKILTSSEMIYGFPYETPETFFDGIETLLEKGVDRVVAYPLQLFPGIDLAEKESREKYAIKTRFRLSDCAYGIYDEGKLISAESEEVVVGTRWSTEADYFTVRRYGFFQQFMLIRGYFVEFFRLCSIAGIHKELCIRYLAGSDYSSFPILGSMMAEYTLEAKAELKSSREELRQEVTERFRLGESMDGVKVNLVFIAKLLSTPGAADELLKLIQAYFEKMLEHHPEKEVILCYLREILPNRIVLMNPKSEKRIRFSSRFNYPKWVSRNYQHISELLSPTPQELEATMDDEISIKLATFNSAERFELQQIMDSTPKKSLLRAVTSTALATI